MSKATRAKRKRKSPVIAETKRRRVLARKGGAIVLMNRLDRQRELWAGSPTVGQVQYLRKIAHAAERHMVRAQDMIDLITLAVTNPDFGKARGDGKGTIGGDTIAGQLAVVIDEIDAIRDVLFTKVVLSHVGD